MSLNNNCPVCESTLTETFLKRNNVPVHQNLLCSDRDSALNTNRGDLDLTICLNCQFIFNKAFDLTKLEYGKDYDNSQNYSDFFNKYTDELINRVIGAKELKNGSVVEVGCGKGLFIKKLVAGLSPDNRGYGFDPSYVGPELELNGRLKFEKKYYGPDCSDIKADIVICRHVIEHVPDPFQLVITVKEAVANSAGAHIFFETPCVEWIIENQVIFDFFYEHCSYFSAHSLTVLFERAGFKVKSVEKVFGGQYLWLEATNDQINNSKTTAIKLDSFLPLLKDFRDAEKKFIEFWQTKIKVEKAKGKVAIWGAGAKGVTFANLIDPDKQLISFFIDLNPNKQGYFIPGTAHQIIDYKTIPDHNIKSIIVMNANYFAENLALVNELNADVELIDLIEYNETK